MVITNLLTEGFTSSTCLTLCISVGSDHLMLLNVYHCTDSQSLVPLTKAPLLHTLPVAVLGDFNTHLPSWSSPGITKSPWADRLKAWMDNSHMVLMNPEGVIMRQQGADRPFILDLFLLNFLTITGDVSPPR
jgi:Endonuclease-reverse transcriptase